MNELITINEDTNGTKTCNARNLHEFLGSKQDFSTWMKSRIKDYDFSEGEDFVKLHKKMARQVLIEYHISLDMAKELSMVERNTKGKEARQYFISCEKAANQLPALPQNYPEALRALADSEEKRAAMAIENKNLKTSQGQISSSKVAKAMNTASVLSRRNKALTRRLKPLQEIDDYIKENSPSKRLQLKSVSEVGKQIGRSGTVINKILEEMGFQEKSKISEKSILLSIGNDLNVIQSREITEDGKDFAEYITHRAGSSVTKSIRWKKKVLKEIIAHLNKD